MPRRRNRQLCECGCNEMTETGRFVRGHATRHRWNLIKAAELGTGLTTNPRNLLDSTEVKVELDSRKWAMPSSRRTFGVEFELTSPVDHMTIVNALRAVKINIDAAGYSSMSSAPQWTVKTDSSIKARGGNRGFEVVSPPLRGKRGENELRKVLKVLNALNCNVNRTCGTHVHVGASDLSVDGIKRVVRAYYAGQQELNIMFPESRRHNRYANEWSSYAMNDLERFQTVRDMAYTDRYRTVNLKPYARIGTIEFRQHNGTLNANKIMSWVDFCRKLVEASGKSQVGLSTNYVELDSLLTAVKTPEESRRNLMNRYYANRAA